MSGTHMGEKINILFIQSQEGFGADSAVHAQIMRFLDRERFAVHVACTPGDGDGPPISLQRLTSIPDVQLRHTRFMPGIRERSAATIVRSIPAAALAPIDFLALRRYVAQNDIKIVHSSERPRDSMYTVALARAAAARSVVHVHVKWANHYSAPAKWAVNHADAVFAISEYVKGTVVNMGRAPQSVYTVLNAIDTAGWDPHLEGAPVRRELSIPEGASVLLSVSRLFSWKGQRELLRAFAEVRRQVPDVVLLIVGDDAPHEGRSFTEELRELAHSLGVLEHVRFTGGRSDIPRVMAAADLFTMPSFEEPFGLVFLEAMAMALPVVGINNGGTPEVVEHGVTGLLAPPWDVPALTENILRLLRDRELRSSMGNRGRQRVLEKFGAQRMAADAGRAYQAILGVD